MSLGLDNLNSRFVYRVLRPDEDPYDNLTCKDSYSMRSIAQHVESGLRIPSQYISTTCSFEMAKEWLETADEKTSWIYGNKRTTIVKIDIYRIKSEYPQIANSAVDLTNFRNLDYFLENAAQKRFANAYQEVVFSCYIPNTTVSVVYTDEITNLRRQQYSTSPHYYSQYDNSRTSDSLLMRDPSSQWIPSEETYEYNSYTNTATNHPVYQSYQSRNNINRNPAEDFLAAVLCVVLCSPVILCIIVIALLILICYLIYRWKTKRGKTTAQQGYQSDESLNNDSPLY